MTSGHIFCFIACVIPGFSEYFSSLMTTTKTFLFNSPPEKSIWTYQRPAKDFFLQFNNTKTFYYPTSFLDFYYKLPSNYHLSLNLGIEVLPLISKPFILACLPHFIDRTVEREKKMMGKRGLNVIRIWKNFLISFHYFK